MSKEIPVIFDCSGGMREMGKGDITGSALRTLRTLSQRYCDCSIVFYLWNDTMTEFTDGVRLTVRGRADPLVLEAFLRALAPGTPVLLLSDGLFPMDDVVRAIRDRRLRLLSVAVGADADHYALRALSAVKRVYSVSELSGVMVRLCCAQETAS